MRMSAPAARNGQSSTVCCALRLRKETPESALSSSETSHPRGLEDPSSTGVTATTEASVDTMVASFSGVAAVLLISVSVLGCGKKRKPPADEAIRSS